MKTVNTHGLVIKGLRAACGQTVNWSSRSGGYTEVFYDRATHEIWTVDQVSLGFNSWTEYHDPDVIKICNTSTHMTMQELADRVFQAVNFCDEAEAAYSEVLEASKEARL